MLKNSEPLISIVIPCLNEEDSIPHVLPQLSALQANLPLEIIVVDDHSTDSSQELLRQFPNVNLVLNNHRHGYGGALKEGFKISRGQHIAFLDMDRTYDPQDLMRLYDHLTQNHLDVVMGNRMSTHNHMPRLRFFGNWTYALALRWTHRVHIQDACSGFRIFSRKLLPDILSIPENGLNFSIAMTIVTLNRGLQIGHLPISYHERLGQSKLSILRDGFLFWRSLGLHWAQGSRASLHTVPKSTPDSRPQPSSSKKQAI
jgi:glycosyltransferase involved in cell wall biosynthesis